MLTEEQVKELETKHGRIAVVRGASIENDEKGKPKYPYEVVFRKPTRGEYKTYRARAHNDQLRPDAQEALCRQCVVYPSIEAFDALLEDWPAIPEAASGALMRLMGMAVEADLAR